MLENIARLSIQNQQRIITMQESVRIPLCKKQFYSDRNASPNSGPLLYCSRSYELRLIAI